MDMEWCKDLVADTWLAILFKPLVMATTLSEWTVPAVTPAPVPVNAADGYPLARRALIAPVTASKPS